MQFFFNTFERNSELSLSVILSQMDGHLEGLEKFFEDYKERLERSKREAMERLEAEQLKFGNFQATERRRRLMKRQMEENMTKTCHDLVQQLRGLTGKTLKDDEGLSLYTTLKDVTNPLLTLMKLSI